MQKNLDRFSAILASVAGYGDNLNIEDMVEALKNTSKRNVKVDVLAQYLADPIIKNLVKRCYNPFERFFISKVKTDQIGYFNIKDIYADVNEALDHLSSRNITGKAAKSLVENILAQLKPESQKVFINILNKDLKCGIGIESINAACPGLVEQFNVQLANKWTRDKDYKVKFWYGSHKFDGIRCMYQNKYPGIMHTREGSELVGFDHIVKDLKTLVDRMKDCPEFMGSGEKELFVDGELFSDNLSFNEIQGIVLSTKNVDISKKKLIYLKVFALGPVKNTADMVKFFEDPKIFEGLTNIKPISYFKVNNDPDEISHKTREFVDQGYEGLMLRHPEQAYDWKRSNALLKSKLLKETEAELTIIGYNPGKPGTKFENTLGTFICRGKVKDPIYTDGKRMPGEFTVTCEVGSGFSDAERAEIWKDPDYYIGKEITVNYQCMSKNSSTGQYSLRFPIKKKDGLKLDRTAEW